MKKNNHGAAPKEPGHAINGALFCVLTTLLQLPIAVAYAQPAHQGRNEATAMTALEFKTKARALVEVESGKELFEIALYAADEKSPITEDGSCRGSGEPKEDHFGTYELISLSNDKVLARTRLGKSFRFREDSVERATVLSLTKPDKSFVVISQYGSCMSTAYYFYRMDSSGKFHSIKFVAKSKRYDSINGKGLDVIGDKIVAFIFDRSVTDGTSREFYKFDGRNMVLSETIPGWGEDD